MTRQQKIWVFIGILFVLGIYCLIQRRNNKPKFYLLNGPAGRGKAAITLPPFGIFINKNRTPEKATPGKFDLAHAKVHEETHWKQFQQQGAVLYYLGYIGNSIIYGYQKNPYEVEARKSAHECAPYELKDGKCVA